MIQKRLILLEKREEKPAFLFSCVRMRGEREREREPWKGDWEKAWSLQKMELTEGRELLLDQTEKKMGTAPCPC